MKKNNEFSLDNYSKGITPEPPTYSILLEKKKQLNLVGSDLNDIKLNSHTIIKNSNLTAHQLIEHISTKGFNIKDIKLFDVGCGLGFLTNELAKKIGYKNVYCCDPAPSAKKFIDLEFPNLNFIYSDIEQIPKNLNNSFDVIYLREVYPFTRTNDLSLHKKLLEKLFNITKKNGIIILEQIKGEKNIFNNLNKLNYKYDIKIFIPNKLFNNMFVIILNRFSYVFFDLILSILYKLKKSKPRYYITFKKL